MYALICLWFIKLEEIKQTSMLVPDSIPLFLEVKLFFIDGRAINAWLHFYDPLKKERMQDEQKKVKEPCQIFGWRNSNILFPILQLSQSHLVENNWEIHEMTWDSFGIKNIAIYNHIKLTHHPTSELFYIVHINIIIAKKKNSYKAWQIYSLNLYTLDTKR